MRRRRKLARCEYFSYLFLDDDDTFSALSE